MKLIRPEWKEPDDPDEIDLTDNFTAIFINLFAAFFEQLTTSYDFKVTIKQFIRPNNVIFSRRRKLSSSISFAISSTSPEITLDRLLCSLRWLYRSLKFDRYQHLNSQPLWLSALPRTDLSTQNPNSNL